MNKWKKNLNLRRRKKSGIVEFNIYLYKMFSIIIFFVTAFFATLSNVSAAEVNTSEAAATPSNSEYTNCTEASQCNLNEGFICKDGLCKCAYDVLKFEAETKRCLASIGGQCGFFIGSSNATMAPCPENSICVWDNDAFKPSYQYVEKHCVCMSGHYKDDSGNCVPYAKFSEKCNEKRKCDSESDLVCSSTTSTCQCPFADDQFYDTELRKCISFVGGNCTMYCVDDAFCENYMPEEVNVNPKRWSMPENSRDYTRETICRCRPGYEPSADRRCRLIPPGYNSPCYGEQEQCDTKRNLQCIDKICQCSNPLHQTYSYELGRCIGSVGDICDPESENSCVLNAKCTRDKESANHFCKCEEGYSATPSRKCMKGHGQQCQNEFCNVFSGLACINKTCQCYDSFLRYDEATMSCVSSVGAPCGKVYLPLELEEFALNSHGPSMRHPFLTNSIRNQYMNMKSMCVECDGYQISCPVGSVCTSDTDMLVVVRGKEKRRCRVPPS